ncbi:MAG TPA: HepT-like ribonuclease domain-containing protein [Bacillota bacterium]|nr:HepT-like ribonuclease domain-containing protein [Bacillota bacterium]
MYNVNTDKINEILTFMENSLFPVFKSLVQQPNETMTEQITGHALSRVFHLCIEGMTDIGNFLIDGFIMRDPGSYEDIVDIMEDETVYTKEQAFVFKQIISLRKSLVIDYTQNNVTELHNTLTTHYVVILQYPQIIREYLQKELW